jgi:hypothetical protein
MAMSRMTTLLFSAVFSAAGLLMVSCDRDQPSPVLGEGVLATVNDVPVTEADIRFASARTGAHGTEGAPTEKKEVLEDIIQQELAYQRAVELGLDRESAYQEQLAKIEAQVSAFKRSKLSAAFFQQEVAKRAAVSDEEARDYFERNAVQLRTEMHVWQILRRDSNSIEQALHDLVGGIPFQEVAGKGFPELPNLDRKPWDLGYLKWSQIPEAWRKVIQGLKIAETSDIIRGPNNRFWIIRLVDMRENPAIVFGDAEPEIMKILRNEKQQKLQQEIQHELREPARIIYP